MGLGVAQSIEPNRGAYHFGIGATYVFPPTGIGEAKYRFDYFGADGGLLTSAFGASSNPESTVAFFGFDQNPGSVVNTLNLSASYGDGEIATATWKVFDSALEEGDRTTHGTRDADILLGGSGIDEIHAGSGDDTLDGGGDRDLLYGGLGDDFYYVKPGDKVFEKENQGTDYLYSDKTFLLPAGQHIEYMAPSDYFTGYDDPIKFFGNEFAQTIWGNSGANTLEGRGGADRLLGNQGNDLLRGGAGDDRLQGHFGKDTLVGGAGKDVMYGGSEADIFLFNAISDSKTKNTIRDVIQDFSQAEHDRLDLRPIDADRTTSGNQSFRLIGDDPFSGQAGEVRAAAHGKTHTLVTGDVTGDGKADFSILLYGSFDMDRGDFLL